MTSFRVLQAATINNAKAFHLENSYGTIQPGKIANLLLLRKNPLETVEAYDAIATVVLRGKALPRATLSANSPQEKNEDHPLIKKVIAYRQANADHDTTRVQALLAKGAARWYEEKEGPGIPIKPAGKTADRFDEFKQWAKKNRPADLQYLMPEGKIVPTLDRAKKWRVVLNEWRKSLGLPVIE